MSAKNKSADDLKESPDDPLARKYPRNFLTGVVVRIDFAEPINLPEGSLPSSIIKRARAIFPIFEEDAEISITFSTTAPPKSGEKKKVFKLLSKDRNKACTISRDHMLIEYHKYQSFEILSADFNTILGPMAARYKKLQSKRFGLRYINTIEPKDDSGPFEWSAYIAPPLLSSFQIDDPTMYTRSFHLIERLYESFRYKLQYGMVNPDYPAAIKKKQYLIDMDFVVDNLLDPDEVREHLTLLHTHAKHLFESLICDGLRNLMRDT